MLEHARISERRACRLAGLSRDAWRHPPQPGACTVRLRERIHAVAMQRRRFGYRRVHDMLRSEFPGTNHKKVYRLYREQGLTVHNGPEFTCRAFMAWLQARGIEHILIQPGKPTQNAYIESFNGRFRDECLNKNWFETLAQAREVTALWRQDYNEVRPRGSIGRTTCRICSQAPRPSAIDAGSVNLQNPGPLSQ